MRCPGCKNPKLFRTIASGNTFGGTIWSDGKVVRPMMPDEPWLRLSESEDVMFWSDECTQIGVQGEKDHPEWNGLEFATEPSEAQYIAAIQSGLGKELIREFYLRQRLWWSGNDRRRHEPSPPFVEDVHRENLDSLAKLYRTSNTPDSLVFQAEILRELSDFEASAAILAEVVCDDNLRYLADRVFDEAEQRNPFVFVVSEGRGARVEPSGKRASRAASSKSLPPNDPGIPRSPQDRRDYYNQEAVVGAAAALAERLGLGAIDQAVLSRHIKPGAKVLDAGCGAGRVALGLWQMGFRNVEACDFAPAQVAAARTLLAGHRTDIAPEEWDFMSLPVPDASYDAVVCLGNTLGELFSKEERMAAVKEFGRVVRPGGKFIFSLRCGARDTEMDCIIGSPRFVPNAEWTGGQVNRDVRFGEVSQAELESFGPRCYHVSERIGGS